MRKIILSLFLLLSCTLIASAEQVDHKYLICLDAGHGGLDGGAYVNGVKEADLTLEITLKLKEVLEKKGLEVILTRSSDEALVEGKFNKRSDMVKRVNLINGSQAVLAISIHLNNFGIAKYRGSQVFYSEVNDHNKLLANYIQSSLQRQLANTDRQIVKRDNVFLLNKVTIPCCIIECGFMSNPEEFKLLATADYQYKMAYAIYYGLEDYLNVY